MKNTIIITLLIALCACNAKQKPIDLTDGQHANNTKYEIGSVAEKPLAGYIKLPGLLRPFEEVNIYGKVNGFVKEVLVDRGSSVRKGQVLVTIEAPEMESQLQAISSKFVQAQENASASKEKYRRLKEAAKEQGAVAPLELDNALSRMRSDDAIVLVEKSNVDAMNNMRGYLTITSPFNGMIVQRNISAGALVGPGSKGNDVPMLVLQYLEKLRLEVFIPEAYVDKVNLESPVSFVFNALPGSERTAHISRSANALTSMRSEAVEIDIHNKDLQLKPGMYAEVKIPLLSAARSLLVPENALIRSTERQYIIKVMEGKAHFVDIREGLKSNDSIEVFGDLQKGDAILLHASDEIKEGATIK
ncbi:RND family efflux transporter MFP subunit [Chitinophaga skermanii]|uniref:RND family efflux transporter MFP subunit n=1 Tax=Chitinophaga skermanii TaxID=331697 RepID=A0A327R4J7_9BACT|nr:efflux RND transporter periplasmic adaptor subunit [Chitinophaga skermanii]RAJ10862.1 RND family efflux transporter MFP subunit [Chitinophaga skermanii]